MTTDKELLTLAAKASEMLTIRWNDGAEPYSSGEGFILHNNRIWNPLTDDGDALRLAAKLNLCIEINATHTRCFLNGVYKPISLSDEGDDTYASTRRAIVRAAAELGRAMP
jgi:hypothetical protein